MKKIAILSIALLPLIGLSQKTKVQTAWRALNDYESSLKDGKPDLSYLTKAKEAIDLALANEDTKNQGKTHAYKARISYAFYQNELANELKKLEATIGDKNERAMLAYGNAPLSNFENANDEINKINDVDPKYMEVIKTGFQEYISVMQGTKKSMATELSEDDNKFIQVAQLVKMDAGNIAQGKYKAKKYDEAATYFYKTAFINMSLTMKKDTANFYNACISAAKAKDPVKILDYNKKMIDLKIATPYNYESMYNAQLNKMDTTAAMDILKKGRVAFPNDMSLMNKETDYFLAKGKQQEALNNINQSIEKDPKNAVFYLVAGQINDQIANPKDKATGKDLPKPDNFEDVIKTAETNYIKAIDLNPANQEILYNSLYNLGAMYNNYGGYYQGGKGATITELAKHQKEYEAKAQEAFKKAIPYLERALTIKADDKPTMSALRKLYLMTGNEAKGKEMNDRIKASGK
ncbi:MAG: hypothetical protein SFY56_08925 [Bacteroidota bacterium]|nr:hypothetical protein [Bacteroidota bacterium]